jgi:hypothetical protein
MVFLGALSGHFSAFKTCLNGQLYLHSKSCANAIQKAHESAIDRIFCIRSGLFSENSTIDRLVS